MASLKVGVCLTYQAAPLTSGVPQVQSSWATRVMKENRPRSAGVVRRMVFSDQPRLVSTPRWSRPSWNVTSLLYLPAQHEPGDDLDRVRVEVGTQESLGREGVAGIVDEHPADRHGR